MPYIERDFAGKIVGVYTNPQHRSDGTLRTEPDPVPDDYPEVVEFMKNMPVLTQAGMTEEDFRREAEDQKRVEEEIPQLQQLLLQHVNVWAEVETGLSALFYTILNIQPSSSHIAYAIYYGLTGFEARRAVVNNALIQLMDENKDLEELRKPWTTINEKLRRSQERRNTIAHSTIQTLIYGTKPNRRKHPLLSPLPFDVIRIGREIKQGNRPGMDVTEFNMAIKKASQVAQCINSISIVIANFLRFGKETLPKTRPELEFHLKALSSP